MEKLIKARKEWSCDQCGAKIIPGQFYNYLKWRDPRYAEDVMGNDVQVGIEYYSFKLCLECPETNEEVTI